MTTLPQINGHIIPDSIWIDFAEVDVQTYLKNRIVTVKQMPKSFVAQWRMVCCATQRAALSTAYPLVSLGGWKAFILLPMMILRSPTGMERDLPTRTKWLTRFAKFWGGNLRTLLEESRQSSTQNIRSSSHNWAPTDTTIEEIDTASHIPIARLAKAETLAKQGLISKAAAVLEQNALAPADIHTFDLLQQLHPRRETPAVSAIPHIDGPIPNISLSDIEEYIKIAIKKSPKLSAPGPSGWRYEHIKWATITQDDIDLQPIEGVLNCILKAQLPEQIKEILRIATLLGIQKDRGGVRPLALSDVLRRLLSKAIAIKYKIQWKEAVGDTQFGIGTTAGIEAVQTGTKLYLELNPTSAVFLADGKMPSIPVTGNSSSMN